MVSGITYTAQTRIREGFVIMSGCYKGCYYYTDSCFRVDCVKGNNRNDNKMYYRIEEVETSTTMELAETEQEALALAEYYANGQYSVIQVIEISSRGERIINETYPE